VEILLGEINKGERLVIKVFIFDMLAQILKAKDRSSITRPLKESDGWFHLDPALATNDPN